MMSEEPDYLTIYDRIYAHDDAYGEPAASRWDLKDAHVKRFFSGVRGRVVDVGCGRGHYVRMLRAAGIDAAGIEISPSCCEKYLQDVPHHCCGPAEHVAEGNRYDALLCTDVVEHIHPDGLHDFLSSVSALSDRALFGVANHSDIHEGIELHLIQQGPGWWQRRLLDHYVEVALVGTLFGGRFFFLSATKGESDV